MTSSWYHPTTWVEWLRNLLNDDAPVPAKALCKQARLQVEKLEERLVPSLTLNGATIAAMEGSVFTGVVGTLVDTGTHAPSDVVSITWGDGGSTSLGTLQLVTGSTYSVIGTHTYSTGGVLTTSLAETGSDGSVSANGSANVDNVNISMAYSVAGSHNLVSSLEVSHSLDLDTSPGTDAGGNPALTYNLEEVNTIPTLSATLTFDSVTDPSPFTLEYFWDGTLQSSTSYNTGSYSLDNRSR
jgi:hypothetical protein